MLLWDGLVIFIILYFTMSTTTQDDDLLIIQDENETTEDNLSFNIDLEDNKPEVENESNNSWKPADTDDSEDAFEIQLDDESGHETDIKNIDSVEEESKVAETQPKEIASEESFEISLDDTTDTVSKENSQKDDSQTISEWVEEKNLTQDISIWIDNSDLDTTQNNKDTTIQKSAPSITSVNETNVLPDDSWKWNEWEEIHPQEDLNDILAWTIKKLSSRKKMIQDDTSSKQSKVKDLKAEIGNLETQVAEIEAEITSLWLESDKIDTNIKQLENMKLDPMKEHNAKRVSKK